MQQYKNKNEQQNFITHFICTMLQINDQFNSYQSIKIFFFIITMTQTIFYLNYSDYNYFKDNISQIYASEMLLYIIRPDIIILQYTSDIVLIIIPYIIISFITLIKIGIILNINKLDLRYIGRWINQSRLQIFLTSLISIYQNLLNHILHIPLQNIVICSIVQALNQFLNQKQGYLAFIIFTTIIFFILEIETITQIFISRQSTTLQILAFEKSNIYSLDFVIYGIQISQIILFGTLPNNENTKYIQQSLTLLIAIIQITNQLINQGYIFYYQRFLLFMINSIIILYSIYSIIGLKNNTIILWPLLGYIVFYIDHDSQLHSLYSIFSIKKVEYHLYLNQLIKFSNNCYQNEILSIQQGLILNQHKIKCTNITCVCKEIITNVIDTKQANIITEPIFKRFLYQKIKNISKWLHKLPDPSYYQITQATLFMRFDFVLLAIKCYNKLLITQQNDYKVKVITSEKSVTKRSSKKFMNPTQVDSQLIEIIQRQQKKAFKYDGINKNVQLTQLNIIKIKYLLQKAQMHLNENFSTNICTPQQITMSNFIYDYFKNEFELNQLMQSVLSLLKLKIEFYTYLVQCENIIADRVFSYLLRYFMQLLKLEDELLSRYEQYQSTNLRQLIIFFYSRIFNSYLKALKFKQINSNQQQKYIIRAQSIDFYSDKIAYILLQLQDDLQNLKIKSYSSNFLKIICRQQNQEIQFSDILPEFIKEQHPILVQRFTQDGKARFYRNLSLTFVQQENGLAKQMEQTFDTVSLLNDNRVIFGAVIQDVIDQKAYMLVNVNNQLAGMTYMCLRKLGYSEAEIFNINDFYQFYEIEISQIVPNFDKMIINNNEQKFSNVKLLFIDLIHFQRDMYNNNSISNLSQIERMWQDSKYTREYVAHLYIMQRDIFGFAYYIIEIESAYFVDSSHQNYAQSYSHYKNTQPLDSAVFDVDSLILSLDEGAAKNVRTFNIQERENYTGYTKQQQQDLEKAYQVMLSPNNSMSHLIDKSANMILSMQRNNSSFQQDFFCQQPANQNAELSSKEVISPLKFQKINQQISETSLGSTKKPAFMKKFQIIDDFYSHSNFAQQQLLVFFITFTLIVFGIYSILVLSLLSNDLNAKIQEIEMLSFQANIVAPYDRYLAIRAQIYYYQGLHTQKVITLEQQQHYVEPLYSIIGLCYYELKTNSYTSLSKSDLKYFFKDVYTNTFFMGMTDKIIYSKTLSFREFIQQLLNYQYDFKIIFDKRIPTKGCPCQVFQFSNYFHLQDNLESMSQEILTFSQNKCIQIIEKWQQIWIVFIVICFVLTLFLFYLRTRVLNEYDSVMEIITHISEQSLLKEIDKQKYLLSNILSNNDFINEYQLQLQTESQQQQIRNEINESTRKNKRKLLAKTSKVKSILFSAIIFGIFLIYSCLVTFSTQSFLNQYQETADFYKLIADLSFRSGNMFLYREMFMLWGNLTYLNKSDGLRLYNLIDIAQNKIISYIDQAPRINLNSLLVPEDFYSYFVKVQNTDVCEFLDEQYSPVLTPYCQLALDGSLQKGMIPALSYISQTIKVQQAINNFSYRAENTYYEVEGGQVASRVFSYMNNQLQNGIIKKTETFNSQNQLLSIFFIIALVSLCAFIVLHYYKEIKTHLQLLKLGVLIIPQSDIIKNDFFERYLKQLEIKLGYRL